MCMDNGYPGLFTSHQPHVLSVALGLCTTCSHEAQAGIDLTVFLPLPPEQRDHHARLSMACLLAPSPGVSKFGLPLCREAISRLHEAVPGVRGSWKKKVGAACGPAELVCVLGGCRERCGHPEPLWPRASDSGGALYPPRPPTRRWPPSWGRATCASLA